MHVTSFYSCLPLRRLACLLQALLCASHKADGVGVDGGSTPVSTAWNRPDCPLKGLPSPHAPAEHGHQGCNAKLLCHKLVLCIDIVLHTYLHAQCECVTIGQNLDAFDHIIGDIHNCLGSKLVLHFAKQVKVVTSGNLGPSKGAGVLLGEEDSPLPNMFGTMIKYFSGLRVMFGPMSQSFSQCLPAEGSAAHQSLRPAEVQVLVSQRNMDGQAAFSPVNQVG